MKSDSRGYCLGTLAFVLHGCVQDVTNFPSDIQDLNDSGIAVGSGTPPSSTAGPLKFYSDGRYERLALPPGTECMYPSAQAINNDGITVGNCEIFNEGSRVLVWNAAGTPTDLGQIEPNWSTRVADINSAGTMIGDATAVSGVGTPTRAWVYENGRFSDLPVLAEQTQVIPAAINDSGEIVGYGWIGDPLGVTEEVAVRWAAGTRAPSRLPKHPSCTRLTITGINSSGTILGNCVGGTATGGVLVWPAGGGAPNLIAADFANRYNAHDINDSGTIVGAVNQGLGPVGTFKPVRWTASGARQILELPGTLAAQINSSGQTLGLRFTDPFYNTAVVVRLTW